MADILIHMEMPEYCYECPCHNGESGYCQAYKSGYLDSIERPAKCPIFPLPEGHGRLIDADALLNNNGVGTQIAGWGKMFHETAIAYAPTIVPAEGGGEECSEN